VFKPKSTYAYLKAKVHLAPNANYKKKTFFYISMALKLLIIGYLRTDLKFDKNSIVVNNIYILLVK